MSDELTSLLKRYDDGELDDTGMARLRELVATPEGRKQALASGAPETIFLADEKLAEPEWDSYWQTFSERMETQDRWPAQQPARWRKPLAMAAMLVIAVGAVFLLQPMFGGGADQEQLTDETFSYVLVHRQPAEVLPDLHTALGEDAAFSIDNEVGSISITGSPEAVERARRALAMLDREPLELPIHIALLQPNNPMVIQTVDALPTEDLDMDDFEILGTLEIKPLEGRQFSNVIDGRYETTCFVRVNAEGTEAHIISLSIFDRETRTMLVRATDITLASGWTRTVDLNSGDSEGSAVAAISLLSGDIKIKKQE